MDQNDRKIIDDLFARLAEAESQAPQRDAQADALIADHLNRHPHAPYYMLQTIAVQQQALEALQQRVEDLENARRSQSGGFLSRLFAPPPTPSRPRTAPARAVPGQMQGAGPWGRPHGGGFMAGAMQTAVGVAGGVLLGNALAGMLTPDPAAAQEPEPEPEPEEGGDFGMDEEF